MINSVVEPKVKSVKLKKELGGQPLLASASDTIEKFKRYETQLFNYSTYSLDICNRFKVSKV